MADLEDEPVENEAASHGPDTSLSFLENPSQPPMGLRMLSLHAAINKLTLVLPVPGDATQFRLEVGHGNFSGDTYLYLFSSEVKCLRRLAVLKDEATEPPASGVLSCHSSSGSLTICSASLTFGDPLLSVQHLPKATPWMLTLKISSSRLLKDPQMKSLKLTVDGCLHGLRLCPKLGALKAWESCSLALQAMVDAIPKSPKTAATPVAVEASSWLLVELQIWNTLMDFKHLVPSPLKSLQLVLPELRFKVADGFLGFCPLVPQWHVVPVPADMAEPDFYLYDCCCQPPGIEVGLVMIQDSFCLI